MNKPDKSWEVLIVGAGPIGLACAIEAKKRKISHLIIEKGCLVNSIFHYPSNMTFFSTSDRLEIGEVPFISHGNKPTRREALEYYRRVADSWKLNIRTYEKVLNVKGQPGRFKVSTTRREYLAAQLIVATGYYDNPNLLGIPGEELDKVKHYYDEPHPYAYREVAVIGAGNSAVDVALELFWVKAKVSMIIRESELKDSIKYWVKPDIENRIKEGSIMAYFNSNLLRIMEEQIVVQTPAGQIVLDNDFVFAMTGYHPDFALLKQIGIVLNTGVSLAPQFDPDSLQTNRPGIYLAGVVCGGMETSRYFIENSREHARSIFDHMENNYSFQKDS
jgi:thioredoxin reductase (NADPH)